VFRTAVCVEACIVAFATSKVIPHILESNMGGRKDLELLDVTAQMEEFVLSPVCISPTDTSGYIADTRTDAIIGSA
jgi:hypothetical protein